MVTAVGEARVEAGTRLADLFAKLPPSGRDFEVFEHVVVGGRTTRSAAGEFKISQTRVCQVLDRVRGWLDEVAPAVADEQTSQRRLDLAVGLAVDRLDFLYGQAMDGWRSSEGEVEKVRCSAYGDEVTTRTRSFGDPRYLTAAARLTLLQSKLASQGAINHGAVLAADLEELQANGPAAAAEESVAARVALPSEPTSHNSNHPVGACSVPTVPKPTNGQRIPKRSDVNVAGPAVYDQLNGRARAARRAFLRPVQEPEPSDLAAAISGGPGSRKASFVPAKSER